MCVLKPDRNICESFCERAVACAHSIKPTTMGEISDFSTFCGSNQFQQKLNLFDVCMRACVRVCTMYMRLRIDEENSNIFPFSGCYYY